MCGIAGKIFFGNKDVDKSEELPLIKKTLSMLYHRGPDDEGYIIDRNVWLGATRLAILDLSSAGYQPLVNEDKSLYLVFNGEIYNYLELKDKLKGRHKFKSQTDSEVLLHLYEDYGVECLKYLRGMFAFAIWDRRKRELFIARDRLGKKPVKYYYNDKFFIFASELKAFIDHPNVPKEVDPIAIDLFLKMGYLPSPKTGFKHIHKLPPGHYLLVRPNRDVVVKRYWKYDFNERDDWTENEWKQVIEEKLIESVKFRLRSDVPLGIHLSGGIDSGIITALSSSISKKRMTTVSAGFDEPFYDELPYAKKIANIFNTHHHEVIIRPDIIELLPKIVYQFEEPFADPSMLPTWLLMQESRKHFTVVLNGEGGDECFAGYPWYQMMKVYSFIKPQQARNLIIGLLKYLYFFTHYKDFDTFAKYLAVLNEDKINNSIIKKMLEDLRVYLPDDLLVKTDITSMANSLEVRSPFLDQEFIELAAQIPLNLKLKGFQTKYILKKIALKYMPKDLVFRRKKGFLPPLDEWFRNKLSVYINRELSDKRFNKLKIVSDINIQKLIDNHLFYRSNNAEILWRLLCLNKWFEVWIDN
ncbi:asparagine synthase (glutamine-hydrolyzing) [Candidatus Gottesmanbacteria bacterium RIFCSPLOWO2_01_FULL_39_12b]|uniref:asparagine synthase (glutamine-hydrolyzing) n=1 Tax=Candidatus Gottesmanbacteria bacterium RIFCSPLOWO2_01_FULL_39_12b TaxID=1798388 RepID=A0A1F6AR16_9BACT|nr:MAG: asparagine synthase (glutamine-hydrolyzing) [Candidatus Gottesmanbacteria bacterium RIFCSPLOWO2_01_FULL_39_12b]